MKYIKPVIILALVGALASTLFAGCQAMGVNGKNPQLEALVQKTLGKIQTGKNGPLTASGVIQADEIRIAAELGGRIVRIETQKGENVRAGQVLIELDATQLLNKLAQAQAAVAAAQADLAVVRAGARAEEIAAAQAMLSLAQAQRDGAGATWQNALEAISNPQELDAQIIEAQTQVDLAEQNAILAQAQLEREKLLRNQTPKNSTRREIADLHLLAAEKALAAAQADLETARTWLHWLQLIRRKPLGLIVQANAAKGQYEIAAQGTGVAQAQLDDLLAGATPQEIAVAERAVELAEAQLGILTAHLAKFTIASPTDGVVLDQTMHVGELAAPAATILTLSDLSQVTLSVYVPENRVGQVWIGQKVQVTVDSFPGRVFAGQVSSIGNQPEFTPRNIATKEERLNTFYAIEITLANPDRALKPGMPADAAFADDRP